MSYIQRVHGCPITGDRYVCQFQRLNFDCFLKEKFCHLKCVLYLFLLSEYIISLGTMDPP